MSLTEQNCQLVLENYSKTKNIKYVKHEIKSFSEHKSGYMGEHFYVFITFELNGEQRTEKFFMKQKPANELHQEFVNSLHLFEKETFLYDVVIKEFENRGYDISFLPKSFNCVDNRAIVMEDLVKQGYQQVERNKSFSMNEIQQVLRALALFHGAGFAYERTKSQELGREYKIDKEYPDVMMEAFFNGYLSDSDSVVHKFLESIKRTVLALIDQFSEDKVIVAKFKDLYVNYELGKIFANDLDLSPKTVGHGDMWSSNLLLKRDGNNVVTDCKLLDFQVLRIFFPSYDVISTIYFNTSVEFFRENFMNLLKFYFDNLENTLKSYGYAVNDIITFDQFLKSIPLCRVECLSDVIFKKITILQPKETFTKSAIKGESFCDFLLNKKPASAVRLFQTNEKAKEILMAHLTDLYAALIERKDIC